MVRRLRGAIWEAEIAMKQANTARRLEGEWAGLGVGVRMAARVGACNYVKLKGSQNLPPVLKIVTCTVHAAYILLMLLTNIHDWCSIFSMVQ